MIAFRNDNTLKAKSLFYDILSNLDLEEGKSNTNASFKDIVKYIDRNISSPDITVSELAEHNGCSAEHFRHKFYNEFNISPKKVEVYTMRTS